MELFIPAMVFNPDLYGKIVRATGEDEQGDAVNFTGIVTKVEPGYLEVRTGLDRVYISWHAVGPDRILIDIAEGFKPLPDNRPQDCDACGGHPEDVADCPVCKGTGRHPDGVPRIGDLEDGCCISCGCPGSCREAVREEREG
jgi:hypothetical protein